MSQTRETRVLLVCGSGVATSTVVNERVKALAAERGWHLVTSLCRVTDVRQNVSTFGPDLVLATTAVPDDLGVPTIPAMALLTGIGEEAVLEQIAGVISELQGE